MAVVAILFVALLRAAKEGDKCIEQHLKEQYKRDENKQ